MGLFDRVEGKLERAVKGVFAKTFRAEVQPVEIASAIRRAMDDRAAFVGRGRALVPNVFTIELSETDYERMGGYAEDLEDELVAAAQEHAESQGYQPGGPFAILLREDSGLETGVFALRPSTAKRPRATGFTGQQPVVRPAAGPAMTPYAAEPGPAAYAPPSRPDDRPRYEQRTAAHEPVHRPRVNPADRPWLDIDGDRYPLMGALTIVGRDDRADIILDDPGISRQHCEIRVTTDGPHFVSTIRDLGSTNGTFVNGERISSERLQPGDRVTVGRTSVTYRVGRR